MSPNVTLNTDVKKAKTYYLNYCVAYKEEQFSKILAELGSDYSEDIGRMPLILLDT